MNVEMLFFMFAIIAAGSVAGYASGLFGIGGGAILVPVFILIFGLVDPQSSPAHMALGTSLGIIMLNTLMSAYKQHKLGNIDWNFFKYWVTSLIPGVITGGILMFFIPGLMIKLLFMGLLLFSLVMLLNSPKHEYSPQESKDNKRYKINHKHLSSSFGIGGLSVLLGIGGGSLTVPYARRIIKMPIQTALGLASISGVLIGIGGTIMAIIIGWFHPNNTIAYSLGYVHIPSVLLVLPFSFWFAPKGVQLANRLDDNINHRLFVALLIACMLVLLTQILDMI